MNVKMSDKDLDKAIQLAKDIDGASPRNSTSDYSMTIRTLAEAVLTLAFARRRLGNDDPHDMIHEFTPPKFVPGVSCVLCGFPIIEFEGRRYDRRGFQHQQCPPKTINGVNSRQVGGSHYGLKAFQHWDMVAMFKLDYFQGQITKYVLRWRDKNGVEDLEKAAHYLEKYIAVEKKAIVDQAQLTLGDKT